MLHKRFACSAADRLSPACIVPARRIEIFVDPVMGPLEIFLVALGPVGRDDARMRYEAAFN